MSFVFLLPQARKEIQAFLAIIFLIFSALTILWPKMESGSNLKDFKKHYFFGIFISFSLLLTCIFLPIGGFIAQPLFLEPSQENAQAILVLASGATEAGDPGLSGYQRVLHGIKLLKEKRAPLLVISTGYQRGYGLTESRWVASLTSLCELEPGSFQILADERIKTSKTEADFAFEKLKERGIDRILLVTNASHLYRAGLVYKKLGLEVLPEPCNSPDGLYYSMGHYLRAFDSALHEWIGLVYYRLRNFY